MKGASAAGAPTPAGELRGGGRALSRGKSALFLAVILLIACGLRLAWVLSVPNQALSDFEIYYRMGVELHAHHQLGVPDPIAYRPPGYPAFLAAVFALTGPSLLAAKLANVFLSLATCILLYLLGTSLSIGWGEATGRWVGLSAALLFAVGPTYVTINSLLASEPLSAVLLLGACVMLLRGERDEPASRDAARGTTRAAAVWLGGSGLLFGLSALTRPAILGILLLLPVWWWLRRRALRWWLPRLALVLLGTGVAIVPWTVRNYAHFRQFVPIACNAGMNAYIGNNPTRSLAFPSRRPVDIPDRFERDRLLWREVWSYVRDHPVDSAIDAVRKIENLFLSPDVFTVRWVQQGLGRGERFSRSALLNWETLHRLFYYLLLGGCLLSLFWPRPKDSAELLIWLLFLWWVLVHVLFWAKPRFRYPIETLMPFLVAALLWIRPRRSRQGEGHGRAAGDPARERAGASSRTQSG